MKQHEFNNANFRPSLDNESVCLDQKIFFYFAVEQFFAVGRSCQKRNRKYRMVVVCQCFTIFPFVFYYQKNSALSSLFYLYI